MNEKREAYESPALVEYGEISEVTKGSLGLDPEDSPLAPLPIGDGEVSGS